MSGSIRAEMAEGESKSNVKLGALRSFFHATPSIPFLLFSSSTRCCEWLLREAMPTFNANPEGGVFLITSSVAGTSLKGSSMAYSVTKAAQLHLMKCLANTQGSKVRVNAVLPGLLLTEWVCIADRLFLVRFLVLAFNLGPQ